MDGAGREVSPRFQFRLNLNVPEEAALYGELQRMPSGKRNGVIVARLLHAGGAADVGEKFESKNPAGQRATGLPDENYGNSYQQY